MEKGTSDFEAGELEEEGRDPGDIISFGEIQKDCISVRRAVERFFDERLEAQDVICG